MNKKSAIIIGVFTGLLLVTGAVLAFSTTHKSDKDQPNTIVSNQTPTRPAPKQPEPQDTTSSAMNHDQAQMASHGSYVTLADYTKNTQMYAESKKVYFFHATWCSVCQAIDTEIKAGITKIPAAVTIIKTDFDSSTDLRKKYGVTNQYTFVQVDNDGNETAQWSATSFQKALNGIAI
ncbi:MAG: thioredoxin family protein [Candidatus Saccharimonadales bacterium]